VAGVGPASPADREFQGGFATALMLKDLKLAVEAAQMANASVPMAANAEALYQIFAGLDGGARDFSAIITMLEGRSTRP
jgi:3-hydroxyisobutyrate dehydrogenase